MKMGVVRTVLGIAAVLTAAPAFAGSMTLTATGKITDISALQNQVSVPVPIGSIYIGDTYTVSASFDLSLTELGSLYDADPTINIYSLPGVTVTYKIGSYSRSFAPMSSIGNNLQLWNDNVGGGGSPVDSQSFSFFDYNVVPSALPFNLGSGQQSGSLSLYAFDFTATARTNDLVSQIAPFTAFGSKSFAFGQLNSTTNLFVYVGGTVTSEVLSITAVPEPATWGMLILGFGVAGGAIRYRRRAPAVSYA